MPPWFYPVLGGCAIALTLALVVAIVAVARAVRRAERLLAVVERQVDRDLPPILKSLRELTDELRLLSRGAASELDRIVQITGRVQDVTESAARLLTALSALTRAGQLVGIAAGIKTGVDVFLHRLRKQRGDDGYE
jgi:hypothetical protein